MDQARETVKETRQALDASLDDGLKTLTALTKMGAAEGRNLGVQQAAKAQEVVEIGRSHLQSTDAMIFGKLHEGVNLMLIYPYESMALGVGALLIALPATRGLLYRSTLGRFRSEEAIFRTSQRQAEALKSTLESASKQGAALTESKNTGLQEVQQGMAKLKSASRELQKLSTTTASAELQAEEMMRQLRRLRSQDALKLRMEVAEYKAGLAKQKKATARDYNQLLSKGYA